MQFWVVRFGAHFIGLQTCRLNRFNCVLTDAYLSEVFVNIAYLVLLLLFWGLLESSVSMQFILQH